MVYRVLLLYYMFYSHINNNIPFATAQGCRTSKYLNIEGTINDSNFLAKSKTSARIHTKYIV